MSKLYPEITYSRISTVCDRKKVRTDAPTNPDATSREQIEIRKEKKRKEKKRKEKKRKEKKRKEKKKKTVNLEDKIKRSGKKLIGRRVSTTFYS